jgi:hypothetical protein
LLEKLIYSVLARLVGDKAQGFEAIAKYIGAEGVQAAPTEGNKSSKWSMPPERFSRMAEFLPQRVILAADLRAHQSQKTQLGLSSFSVKNHMKMIRVDRDILATKANAIAMGRFFYDL